MLKSRAIVYVTDEGFLMPSLFSASQVASRAGALAAADIFVVLVGVGASEALRSSFARSGIQFLELDRQAFWRTDETFFNQTHVPVTSLGRLAIQSVLPDRYEHVLYLDGDTYIAGDIADLIDHTVAPGKIAAARDCSWLSRGQLGSFWRQHETYSRNLGLADPSDYFNAGVLAFRMETWREMAPKALEFFETNPQMCRYHDQSALNHVFRDRREVLSPIWNCQSGYFELGVEAELDARIFHFTGGLKPWRTRKSVWGESILDEYAEFIDRYPAMGASRSTDNPVRSSRGKLLDVREMIENARKVRKRTLLRRYLAHTRFAL